MNIDHLFEQFTQQHILVVGDIMLDTYTFGDVHRISPEAPVPIVNISHTDKRLGGAANVALNLKSLGAQVSMIAITGNDAESSDIISILQQHGINSDGVLKIDGRKTTVKNRVVANKHQMIRIDSESTDELTHIQSLQLIQTAKKLMDEKKFTAIIFEDYDKGTLNEQIIKALLEYSQQKNIPTTVDPKKRNFDFYNGASLFKPNLREFHEGLNFTGSKQELLQELAEIGKEYCKQKGYRFLFITLSEHGVFICDTEKTYHEKAHLRSISDVSGAGDTVIAVATLCLAAGCNMSEIASIANMAGGLVCEKLGVVSIGVDELKAELSVEEK
jgi:rfaE bifunctional protein kinase chain/domain